MIRSNRKTVYAGVALVALALAGLSMSRLSRSDDGGARASADGSMATETASRDQIVAVTLPRLDDAQSIGQKVFLAKCASCHGETAGGRNGLGPPLIHKIYEPSHHGDMAFFRAAELGVRAHHWKFGNMAPVEDITRAEVADVVAFIRAVQRENGIH
ncbi:cytochrome c [Aliiroseovarius sp. S1339]|uniref:c-type cytochrome n=1 Tax=Aliiroseovarius sp. S1339 TaxID=2936990 RepID=UPI0020BF7AB8|nr:c-type cytochrome [Aliiroseovarius sp. S1339]MCK8462530.1 cytochrome c [Aliiroseovarius sp. S1339]